MSDYLKVTTVLSSIIAIVIGISVYLAKYFQLLFLIGPRVTPDSYNFEVITKSFYFQPVLTVNILM